MWCSTKLGIIHSLINIQPIKWTCSISHKRPENLLIHTEHLSQLGAHFHFGNKLKQYFLVSLALRLIYFSFLSAVFCGRGSPKTWPYNHGFLWSYLAIIPDTKSTALTGTVCQIKPFNDKFSPNGKFLLDYIVGKGFELDIELKQQQGPANP